MKGLTDMNKKFFLKLGGVTLATILTMLLLKYTTGAFRYENLLNIFIATCVIGSFYIKWFDLVGTRQKQKERDLILGEFQCLKTEVVKIKEVLIREGFVDKGEVSLKAKVSREIKEEQELKDE